MLESTSEAAVAALATPRQAASHIRRPERRALVRIALAAVFANASWFSATAVVPALEREWHLGSGGAALLVVAVQLGFVIGSVGSAFLNLPDRLEARCLIGCSAIAAGT